MRKRQYVVMRRMKCPECGNEQTAPKMRTTEKEHVKTMWCPWCRCMRDMVQVDSERVRAL